MVVCLLAYPEQSDAYIDLGLGGQIFQVVSLLLFGFITFVLSPTLFFWKRITKGMNKWRRAKE